MIKIRLTYDDDEEKDIAIENIKVVEIVNIPMFILMPISSRKYLMNKLKLLCINFAL